MCACVCVCVFVNKLSSKSNEKIKKGKSEIKRVLFVTPSFPAHSRRRILFAIPTSFIPTYTHTTTPFLIPTHMFTVLSGTTSFL